MYLKFPKGPFRPVGGSTKLAKVNDGPYTVRERLLDGLVYTVEHDVMGYTSNVSVTRMIQRDTRQSPRMLRTFQGDGSSCETDKKTDSTTRKKVQTLEAKDKPT